MINTLKEHKRKFLYHFTDKSNWDSIEEHGILSLREIQQKNIENVVYGGNELSHNLDKSKEFDDYVHLTFIPSHPMRYVAMQDGRIKDPIWIKIDLSILLNPDVRYTADVSNKNGVPILDEQEAKGQIDFDVLFEFMTWAEPEIQQRRNTAEKSEILIPRIVPPNKIKGCFNGK